MKIKTFDELNAYELYEIIKSRNEVFLLEQNIVCQDLDDVDYRAFHFFTEEEGRVTSYLRAFYTNEEKNRLKIGRVLTLNRGKGDGRRLMEKAFCYFKECGAEKITVNAQTQAKGFYEKLGFKVCSDEFLEEGVPHIAMEYEL